MQKKTVHMKPITVKELTVPTAKTNEIQPKYKSVKLGQRRT